MQNFFSFNSHHQHQKQQSQGFSLQICSTILVNRQWDRLFSVLRLSPLSNLPPLLHTHMSLIYYRRHITLLCGNKMPTRCNRDFIADLIACSTCVGHHIAHHQELKSIIQWLLRVVFCAVVFQVAGLVWSWGLCVRFAGCCSILQPGRITLSSTPDQLLEKPQHEIPQAATTV